MVAGESVRDAASVGAECVQFARGRQRAVPEQPRRLFERRVRRELADGEAGDDQRAGFAIDVTERRRGGDDAFEPAVDW